MTFNTRGSCRCLQKIHEAFERMLRSDVDDRLVTDMASLNREGRR